MMGDDEFFEPAPDGVERPEDEGMSLEGALEADIPLPSVVPNAGEASVEEPDA